MSRILTYFQWINFCLEQFYYHTNGCATLSHVIHVLPFKLFCTCLVSNITTVQAYKNKATSEEMATYIPTTTLTYYTYYTTLTYLYMATYMATYIPTTYQPLHKKTNKDKAIIKDMHAFHKFHTHPCIDNII